MSDDDRPAKPEAEAILKHFGLSSVDLIGLRFAINVALATTIVWNVLHAIGDPKPIWAIASMVAASDPQPEEARRLFRSRLVNVAVGSAAGLTFLIVAGRRSWVLPLALATTVLISSYVVRIKTMWRQAPITAAVVIAAAISSESSFVGIRQGLHKVAEVVFGCIVGMTVSLIMSKVWLIPPSAEETDRA
jgi:uncharacterized membrane protein YgaE (UPF0421/DUF939 family)